jgi:hypothetical protein
VKLIEPGWKPLFRVPASPEAYTSTADAGKNLGAAYISSFNLTWTSVGGATGAVYLTKEGPSGATLQVQTNGWNGGGLTASGYSAIGIKTVQPIDGFHAVLAPTFQTWNCGSGPGFSSDPSLYLIVYDAAGVSQLNVNLRQYAIPNGATTFASPNGLGISIVRSSATQVTVHVCRANDYTSTEYQGYATQTLTVGNGFYVELLAVASASTSGNTAPLNVFSYWVVYDPVYKEL